MSGAPDAAGDDVAVVVDRELSWPRRKLVELANALSAVDDEARVASAERRGPDLKLLGVVVLATVGLTLIYYYGTRIRVGRVMPAAEALGIPRETWMAWFKGDSQAIEFNRYLYGAIWIFVFYLLVPLSFATLVKPRMSLADLGLKLKGAFTHWRWYVLAFAAILPFIIGVAQLESFVRYYPIWDGANASLLDLLKWWAIYLPQFLCVEFLFRGFLIFPFRKRMGSLAVLVPIAPYCMIHFNKPVPEVLGAIVAGLVLGTIALLTRSIWLGVAIHISVAMTMDVLAIFAAGGFTG